MLKAGLGDRIKKIIERRDWKQTTLANKLGINKSVMSRIIAGTRPVEDSLLLKMTEVLGVSSDYLIGADEREKSNELTEDERKLNEIDQLVRDIVKNKGIDETKEFLRYISKNK